MEHLTPFDALFLQAEDADPHASLMIGGVVVIEGPVPTHREFLDAVASRLDAVPHARQVVHGFPFDLGAPVWVDDPYFDIAHHVGRTTLPALGDEAALDRLVGHVMDPRLDREHPLWKCWIVEGLPDGRWAILAKMHRCMAGGLSGARLIELLCDYEAGARVVTIAGPQPKVSTRSLSDVILEVIDLALSPRRQAAFMARQLTSPIRLTRTSLQVIRGLMRYGTDLFAGSSAPVLNSHLGRHRAFAAARTSLDDVRLIRDTFDTTVNDVALAAIASALPVPVRADEILNAIDNRISIMVPSLPVEVADPVARLLAVKNRVSTHEFSAGTEAEHAIATLAERWPFAPVAWTVQMAARLPQRAIVAVGANIPGPT
ncbi:wax ester/triacylglycerol synthase domain-containing protein, partial [Smaragdicoccus niigatensis]